MHTKKRAGEEKYKVRGRNDAMVIGIPVIVSSLVIQSNDRSIVMLQCDFKSLI